MSCYPGPERVKDCLFKLRDMDKIRELYIPTVVKDVISKHKPQTEGEFIQFSQALYDVIVKKIEEIRSVVRN
jgi:hypothetical protein